MRWVIEKQGHWTFATSYKTVRGQKVIFMIPRKGDHKLQLVTYKKEKKTFLCFWCGEKYYKVQIIGTFEVVRYKKIPEERRTYKGYLTTKGDVFVPVKTGPTVMSL